MAATLKQLAARNDAQHYIGFLSARLLFNADTQSVIQAIQDYSVWMFLAQIKRSFYIISC